MRHDPNHPPAPGPLAPRPPAREPAYVEAVPYGYGGAYPEEPERSSLLEYWHILRRRKGALVLFGFFGALLGVLTTVPQTPVYQARTAIEIQALNENFLNMREVSPVMQTETMSYGLTDIPTQVKILQSETLIERVLDKLKVRNAADLAAPVGRVTVWRRALNLPEPDPLTAHQRALGLAAGSLKVRSAEDTRILEILSDSTDPSMAARFANTLVDEYIRENLESRWNMAQRTGEWLTRQLQDLRNRLERSEDALQSYARSSGLMFTGEKNSLSEEKLRQLQADLGRAQSARLARQSRFEMAGASSPETLPEVLNDASLRGYQAKLTDLQRQLAELGATFTGAHAGVKALRAQVAAVEAAFQRERDAILKAIRNEYEDALRQEKLLLAEYTRQSARVAEESEKAIQYNILKREAESNRQLYDAMFQRVKESSIASAIRASNVRVVDPAKPPSGPYKPQPSRSGAMGVLAGLFLGALFVIVRDRLDRTIRNPEDADLYLGVSELGVIPSAESARRRLYYARKARRLRAGGDQPLGDGQPAGDGQPPEAEAGYGHDCVELVTLHHQASGMAESFRVTLASILFAGHDGDRPKVLVITSPGPREGKTAVTSNLGVALAEVGHKVLVIDGDLRRPRLHEVFGLDNTLGLSDFLKDRQTPLAEAISGAVRETRLAGLWVLPAGPHTAAAANLLYSPRLPELLKAVRQDYDMVLIDTPPMLQLADARLLGRLADAVVLIIRAGKTTRDAAQAARDRLSGDGIEVLGTILNDWNPRATHPGYHSYHRHYPYYHHQNGD